MEVRHAVTTIDRQQSIGIKTALRELATAELVDNTLRPINRCIDDIRWQHIKCQIDYAIRTKLRQRVALIGARFVQRLTFPEDRQLVLTDSHRELLLMLWLGYNRDTEHTVAATDGGQRLLIGARCGD